MPSEPLEGSFFFDPQDSIYADHFPGNPVVPGSMIIQAFMLAAKELCAERRVRSICGFRFKKFLSPGKYPYRIEVFGREIRCSLLNGNSVIVTGALGL